MTGLSPRATQFLKSLRRRPAVTDIPLIRAAFTSDGIDVPDVWVDFHNRYAGFVIDLGAGALAVLGIAHRSAENMGRAGHGGLYYCWDDERPQGGALRVDCADAHPSFEFVLTDSGHFLGSGCGGGADSLDIKIEQWAIWSTSGIDKTWTVRWLRGETAAALVTNSELAKSLVRDASDTQSTMYAGVGFVLQHWSHGTAHLVAQRGAPAWLKPFLDAYERP